MEKESRGELDKIEVLCDVLGRRELLEDANGKVVLLCEPYVLRDGTGRGGIPAEEIVDDGWGGEKEVSPPQGAYPLYDGCKVWAP